MPLQGIPYEKSRMFSERHPFLKQAWSDASELTIQQLAVPSATVVASFGANIVLGESTSWWFWVRSAGLSLGIGLLLYVLIALIRAPFVVMGRHHQQLGAISERLSELENRQISTLPLTQSADNEKARYRRELIHTWRKMLSSADHEYRNIPSTDGGPSFAEVLERRPEYLSLKQHLSAPTLAALRNEKHDGTIHIVETGRRTEVNPAGNLVNLLIEEIARIESNWDLV